jgi:nucleotidyltransferase substrate binding protein (TIGR01987 family)
VQLNLSSLRKAIDSLGKALQITADKMLKEQIDDDEIDLIKAGVIQNFEFTYELCWKLMKRWIETNISTEIVDGVTRRELFRLSAENRLIIDVDVWMEFHRARNISSHIYEREIAEEVYQIAKGFHNAAMDFLVRLEMRND